MDRTDLKIGDVVLLVNGRDKKVIGHTDTGKIILPKNKVNVGYAEVLSIDERDKCVLCELKNVVKDYYYRITYEDFMEVLKIHGYTIGFDRIFESPYEYGDEHQIMAYNIDINTIIVAETFYGGETFNSINVYCPNMNGLRLRWNVFSHGSRYMAVLNLCNEHGGQANILQEINDRMLQIKRDTGVEWPKNESPSLWTYADKSTPGTWDLWDKTIDRVLLANEEIDQIFKNCGRMKPIMAKRQNKSA